MTTINKRISRDVLRHLRIEIWCFFMIWKTRSCIQDIRCGAGDWRWSGWMDHLMKRHRSVSSNSKCKIFLQRFESSLWNLALTFVQVFVKWYLPFRPLQKHFAVVLHQSEERQFAQLLLSHICKKILLTNGTDMKTLSFTHKEIALGSRMPF